MRRVVWSGTTRNGDVVFYDDAEWAPSGGSTFGSADEVKGTTQQPSNAARVTPPPQASVPGAAIDNDQQSLAMTVFFPLAGIYPPRGDGGNSDAGGSFIGEIGIFAGNFGPNGAPLAAGQLLPINQNTAVFSLLGTTYGGNGQTNFALPNLTSTTMIGAGQGPGLSLQTEGTQTGSSSINLTS